MTAKTEKVGLFLSLMVIFALLFVIGIINLRRSIPTFGIGIPIDAENWTVIVLSFIGIVKFFVEIIKH